MYYQMSDILMQATYIRVTTKEGEFYAYDSATGEFVNVTTTGTVKDFVPDNYANYQLNDGKNTRKVIVDFDNFSLVNEKGVKYPDAGAEIDNADKDKAVSLQSFRVFSMVEDVPLYIEPQYIYVEYSCKSTEAKKVGDSVVGTTETKACVLFQYDKDAKQIYLYRSDDGADVPGTVNFEKAKADIKVTDVLADDVKNFYFTADSDANSVGIALDFENSRNAGYRYHLKETVNFRNSNVLSVKPQLLLKKANTGEKVHEVGAEGELADVTVDFEGKITRSSVKITEAGKGNSSENTGN
jgi:hypothetical protein